MNLFILPWDVVLILALMATIIPWRGAARIKALLSKPELLASDRLRLYGSTILFQWIIAAIVSWRALARGFSFSELGLTAGNPWRAAIAGIALTGVLCASQIFGLRRLSRMPANRRGRLFAITQKIMPRTARETWAYAALALTAGVSEEFLYRGFVFAAFSRVLRESTGSLNAAAILSSVWFAVAHIYQGRRGVVTTFVVALIFVSARVWTSSLLPSFMIHFAVDLVVGVCVCRLFSAEMPSGDLSQ